MYFCLYSHSWVCLTPIHQCPLNLSHSILNPSVNSIYTLYLSCAPLKLTIIDILTEFASHGELWDRLRNPDRASGLIGVRPSEARFYAAQLVSALEYCAQMGIVHRDIKPENILLFHGPHLGAQECILQITDFGSSKDLLDASLDQNNFVGTPEYMSPEAIHGRHTAAPADVWSFACTLYQLHTGTIPFQAASPYLTFLKVDALNYSIPGALRDTPFELLLRAVLQTDPAARPSFAQIKDHAYFRGVDFDVHGVKVIPPPTAFEQEVEDLGRRLKLGDASFDVMDLPVVTQLTLANWLEQRCLFEDPLLFQRFFPTIADSRYKRYEGIEGLWMMCSWLLLFLGFVNPSLCFIAVQGFFYEAFAFLFLIISKHLFLPPLTFPPLQSHRQVVHRTLPSRTRRIQGCFCVCATRHG